MLRLHALAEPARHRAQVRAAVAAMGVVAPEGTLVRTGGRLHATPSFAMLPRARARAGQACCRLRLRDAAHERKRSRRGASVWACRWRAQGCAPCTLCCRALTLAQTQPGPPEHCCHPVDFQDAV